MKTYTQGLLNGVELKPPRSKDVCPICLKKCAFFLRLTNMKMTDGERAKHLVNLHKNVCCRCRRQRCNGRIMQKTYSGARIPVLCINVEPKKLGKKQTFPTWWAGNGK